MVWYAWFVIDFHSFAGVRIFLGFWFLFFGGRRTLKSSWSCSRLHYHVMGNDDDLFYLTSLKSSGSCPRLDNDDWCFVCWVGGWVGWVGPGWVGGRVGRLFMIRYYSWGVACSFYVHFLGQYVLYDLQTLKSSQHLSTRLCIFFFKCIGDIQHRFFVIPKSRMDRFTPGIWVMNNQKIMVRLLVCPLLLFVVSFYLI